MHYRYIDIKGLKCIEWHFPEKMDKPQKQNLKDTIGKENYDMPMLDKKAGKGKSIYCDAIFVTENVNGSRDTKVY